MRNPNQPLDVPGQAVPEPPRRVSPHPKPTATEPANPLMERATLRDHFAGLAMSAMCAGEGARMVAVRDDRYDETNWAEVVAKNAYEFADAMLKERERGR